MKSLKEHLKNRPSVSDKWSEVKDIMATHLYGKPPELLFRTRRPLESTNAYALTYRLENFQPITKGPFNTATNGVIEVANHIYVDVEGLEPETIEYLNEQVIRAAGKTFTVKDYVTYHIAKMVEADPNAVLVVLPYHPSADIIPDFREELPSFNDVPNEPVRPHIRLVSSDHIHSVSTEELIFEAGEWVYAIKDGKEKTAPYYWMLTAEQTSLIIPRPFKDSYDYEIVPWYANGLSMAPFDTIGNNPVYQEVDGEWVEYQESTWAGAVAIANEMVGIKSDEQICTTRFVYPEKFMQMERCGHPGCIKCSDPESKYAGLFVVYDAAGDCSTCGTCNGTGLVKPDTSPLGTHWVAKSDLFSDDGRFVPPVTFITPPLESPEFLAKRVAEEYERMEDALFITRQNMTNQSGESKAYDLRQKVTVIGNAVRNIYNIYENLLNTIQGYLLGFDAQNVRVVLPPDFHIKTSEDITYELGLSKATSSVYTSELTRELLLKKFGNTDANRRIIDFLELNDRLFGMTTDEIVKLKAIYGSDLTSRDQVIHDKGWAVLQKMAVDPGFLRLADERLRADFNKAIDNLMGLKPAEAEVADDPLLQLEAEAKSKLKGTVGGVQGIIQINAAVAAGQMTEESAQALLQEIYGFSKEIADRLIEPVSQVTATATNNTSPIA